MPNAMAVCAVLSGWLSDWAHSLDPIQLLIYFSSLTTAAYGVFATITDFHEKKKGKQVLSRKGRFGIAFLLLSFVIGFTADGAKDYQAKKEAEKAKAAQEQLLNRETATLQSTKDITSQLTTTNDQLSHTAATTKTILDVSRRAEDQFNTADSVSGCEMYQERGCCEDWEGAIEDWLIAISYCEMAA